MWINRFVFVWFCTDSIDSKCFNLLATDMGEGLVDEGEIVHKEPSLTNMPARAQYDGEWNEGVTTMEAALGQGFRWDPSMAVKPPKKKRASRKEKGEKAEKAPTGKKRGRKPKTDKLGSAGRLADTGGAVDWVGFPHPSTIQVGANPALVEEKSGRQGKADPAKSPPGSGANSGFPAFAGEVCVLLHSGLASEYRSEGEGKALPRQQQKARKEKLKGQI